MLIWDIESTINRIRQMLAFGMPREEIRKQLAVSLTSEQIFLAYCAALQLASADGMSTP